jgi:hypothetical protein
MGWDYVSKLRPPVGLLLIPKVIHEHGEPWWSDSAGENSLFIHHSFLAILPAESSSSKAGGTGEVSYEFDLTKYGGFLTCHKIWQHGADSVTSPRRKACVLRIFIALENLSPSVGIGYSAKHTSHYTTEGDSYSLNIKASLLVCNDVWNGRNIPTFRWNILHPQGWRWRNIPFSGLRRWYLPTSPRGITSQKINIDIFTAVRSSHSSECVLRLYY